MTYAALPHINAVLNATSAVLLLAGLAFIGAKRIGFHVACMMGALVLSALFLISYLVYHAHHGATPFPGTGWTRPAYLALLISHTVLAAAILPLALMTVKFAAAKQWDRHVRLARWTFPIWIYVSITGVCVYWILYHVYAA